MILHQKTILTFNNITDTEVKILYLIRRLKLFDSVEIKYSKQGELQWILTSKDKGVFDFTGHTE
jgi:hypothetical protein